MGWFAMQERQGSVEQLSGPVRLLRFGVYKIDLEAGELRKSGRKVSLQGQPFQVLVLLLTHAGRVMTREELQKRLWPADTFVDFDLGLNTAIRKIRAALGDSPDNPRFVETLPKKGYRFIYPVEEVASSVAGTQPTEMPIATQTAAGISSVPRETGNTSKTAFSSHIRAWLAAGVVVALAAGLSFYWLHHRTTR